MGLSLKVFKLKVLKGIRDPISPLNFILCLELIFVKINLDPNIRGTFIFFVATLLVLQPVCNPTWVVYALHLDKISNKFLNLHILQQEKQSLSKRS